MGRFGRGFTLQELRAAGMNPKQARTVGIAVDHRRTSTSEEQLQSNVARLNSYKSKLIVFPRDEKAPKLKGLFADATAEQLKSAAVKVKKRGRLMPVEKKAQEVESVKITAEDQKKKAYHSLRSLLPTLTIAEDASRESSTPLRPRNEERD